MYVPESLHCYALVEFTWLPTKSTWAIYFVRILDFVQSMLFSYSIANWTNLPSCDVYFTSENDFLCILYVCNSQYKNIISHRLTQQQRSLWLKGEDGKKVPLCHIILSRLMYHYNHSLVRFNYPVQLLCWYFVLCLPI